MHSQNFGFGKSSTLGLRDRMISGVLENIIFLELKRRGYQSFVGKLGDREIDFVAEKKGRKIYIQVAYKIESNETAKREFAPLLAIKDQYPKYVITMDDFWEGDIEGGQHIYIAGFLLQNQ